MTVDPNKRLLQLQLEIPIHDLLEMLGRREQRSKTQQATFMLKEALAARYPDLLQAGETQQGTAGRSNNGGKPANKEK